jgi:uncharacterized protein
MFRILQNDVPVTGRQSSPAPPVVKPPHAEGRLEQLADWVFLRKFRTEYLLIRSFPFNVVEIKQEEVHPIREFFAGRGNLDGQLLQILRTAHMLDGDPGRAANHLSRHVSAILLVTTACNLACSRCFASGGDYGLGRFHMTREVIEATISYLSREITTLYQCDGFLGHAQLGLHFFGGEPFIAFDRMQFAVERAERAANGLSQTVGHCVRPDFFVTTNGTLLNSERTAFLRDHRFTVLVSIDGPDHDARRSYASGKGSLAKVIEAFGALRAVQVPLRLNTVIRNSDVPYIREILSWFRQEVYQHEPSMAIYHTFSFEREGPAGTVGSCGSEHTSSALDEYVGELENFDASGYQLYELALRTKLATGGTFYKCSSGVKRIAVGPNGRVYPCQGFIDTKLDMGSILAPDFDHRQTKVSQCMAARNIATLLPCRNCVFSALCPHNVDCAARAHYTLGGLMQIDVNGMCRVGFDLMDRILFDCGLLDELATSKSSSSKPEEKA